MFDAQTVTALHPRSLGTSVTNSGAHRSRGDDGSAARSRHVNITSLLTSHTKVLSGGVVCDRFGVFLQLSLLAKHSYLVTEAPPKIGGWGGEQSHFLCYKKAEETPGMNLDTLFH